MKQKKIIVGDAHRTSRNIQNLMRRVMKNEFMRIRLANQIKNAILHYESTDILSVLKKTAEQCNTELNELGPEILTNLPAQNAYAMLKNLCIEAEEYERSLNCKWFEH